MEGQKETTFKVAKAIKEAGYPQNTYEGAAYYTENGEPYHHNSEYTSFEPEVFCLRPTYLDVWMWLWREKKIKIEPVTGFATYIKGYEDEIQLKGYEDPEDAIIAAIDYLVDNAHCVLQREGL